MGFRHRASPLDRRDRGPAFRPVSALAQAIIFSRNGARANVRFPASSATRWRGRERLLKVEPRGSTAISGPGVHHAFDVAQLKPGRSSAGRWLEFDEPAARDAEEKTRAFLADNLVSIAETQQPGPR